MKATWIAAGLFVLCILLQVADVVELPAAVWVVLALALVSGVVLDVMRKQASR